MASYRDVEGGGSAVVSERTPDRLGVTTGTGWVMTKAAAGGVVAAGLVVAGLVIMVLVDMGTVPLPVGMLIGLVFAVVFRVSK